MSLSGRPESWACEVCTYRHDGDDERLFLACAVCASTRPTPPQGEGGGRAPKRRRTAGAADSEQASAPASGGNQSGSADSSAGAAEAAAATAPLPQSSTQPASAAASAAPKTAPSDDALSLLRALRPRRSWEFVLQAEYRAGPRQQQPTRVAYDDLPALAPLFVTCDVLPRRLADALTEQLARGTWWRQGAWRIHGKTHAVPRTTARFRLLPSPRGSGGPSAAADADAYDSSDDSADADGSDVVATPELREVARVVEAAVAAALPQGSPRWVPTYAFGNRYASGSDHVSWHSDHLTGLGPRPVIAGLTLGASRRFAMRRADRSGPSVSVVLPHNSLAVMLDDAQEAWEHAVPEVGKGSRALTPHRLTGPVRFSLTFRAERSDMPDFGCCGCGRPAALRCNDGRYFLVCRPSGGTSAEIGACGMRKRCPWADEEAARLRAQQASLAAAQRARGERAS